MDKNSVAVITQGSRHFNKFSTMNTAKILFKSSIARTSLTLAIVDIAGGVINFALSIILINYYWILGVAFGTAIPLTISRLIILPLYVCQCIELSVKKYFLNISSTIVYTITYLGLFYLLTKNILNIPQYSTIIIVSIAALPVYISINLNLFRPLRMKPL